jgi:hypothetical protein
MAFLSAVGDSAKKNVFCLYMYVSTSKLNISKTKKSFLNQIFSESLYIHVLLAQRVLAL